MVSAGCCDNACTFSVVSQLHSHVICRPVFSRPDSQLSCYSVWNSRWKLTSSRSFDCTRGAHTLPQSVACIIAMFLLRFARKCCRSPFFAVIVLLKYGGRSETALDSSGRTSPLAGHPTPYLDHPYHHTRLGTPPTFGFAARGRQRFFFKRHFLRNGCRYRHRSFAVMCAFGVPIQRPYTLGSLSPHLGVRFPQVEIYVGGP